MHPNQPSPRRRFFKKSKPKLFAMAMAGAISLNPVYSAHAVGVRSANETSADVIQNVGPNRHRGATAGLDVGADVESNRTTRVNSNVDGRVSSQARDLDVEGSTDTRANPPRTGAVDLRSDTDANLRKDQVDTNAGLGARTQTQGSATTPNRRSNIGTSGSLGVNTGAGGVNVGAGAGAAVGR